MMTALVTVAMSATGLILTTAGAWVALSYRATGTPPLDLKPPPDPEINAMVRTLRRGSKRDQRKPRTRGAHRASASSSSPVRGTGPPNSGTGSGETWTSSAHS